MHNIGSEWKQLSENRVLLCRKGSCCPVVEILEDGNMKIEDDNGDSILLSKNDILELRDFLNVTHN